MQYESILAQNFVAGIGLPFYYNTKPATFVHVLKAMLWPLVKCIWTSSLYTLVTNELVTNIATRFAKTPLGLENLHAPYDKKITSWWHFTMSQKLSIINWIKIFNPIFLCGHFIHQPFKPVRRLRRRVCLVMESTTKWRCVIYSAIIRFFLPFQYKILSLFPYKYKEVF